MLSIIKDDTPNTAHSHRPVLYTSECLTCQEYSEDQLHLIEHEWRKLYQDSECTSVFCSPEWTKLWWKHFQRYFPEGQVTMTVLTAWKGDLLIGIAPFSYPNRVMYRTKRLRPLGDVGQKEGMTEETPLLVRRQYQDDVIEAFYDYLQDPIASNRWDCAFLRQSDRTTVTEVFRQIAAPISKMLSAPRIASLPPTWNEYFKGLSRSMKTNIKYYPRKLEKQHFEWEFRIASTVDEITVAIPDLIRLHRERANSTRGVKHCNHIPTEIHEKFLMEVLVSLAERGEAWIGTIEINGVTVASQAFLQSKQTLTFYYSGFNIAFYDYSPLLIVATEAIKHSINCGIAYLNFLPDTLNANHSPEMVSEWKARWGAVPTGSTWEIAVYPQHPRASLVKAVRAAKTFAHLALGQKSLDPTSADLI